ncbi:Immunoglobulin-like domain [Trinorchestia longiramus]|nr:Immunoglobulin-like domain [Trinorchestia longiramus]
MQKRLQVSQLVSQWVSQQSRSRYATERPQPPVITGAQEEYTDTEVVQLVCTPRYLSAATLHTQPPPTITWYIGGQPAPPEHVQPHRTLPRDPLGLALSIPAYKVRN